MQKIILSLFVMIATVGVLASLPAYAQEATIMTDEHIARIKTNCQTAIVTLNQIHANDAPVYINRNQAYFSISDKLIARLNSRLALNRHDTTQFAGLARDYNTALANFRTTYKQYDDKMAELIKMNCSRQPVGFYDKVNEAKQLRNNVHTAVKKLNTVIDQYRQAVETLKGQLKEREDD